MSSILLFTGRMFDPSEIEKQRFTALDFIHPISLLNRYTGHTAKPISVAEHTVHLADCKQVRAKGLERAATIHDFGEALTNDIPHPYKKDADFKAYVKLEERVQRHIFNVFGEPWENMEALNEFDRRICADEMAQGFSPPYAYPMEPLGVRIKFWSWKTAERHLTSLCREVGVL
ncbi:MAG: hypothetical protein EOQ39_18895 [Mesorhizobium sp.]|uniref:hypothetical protein n=1 Tax=Mesorhizobium sp. TaxID=1871066 RepID=UPI000FE88E08|nr:hypothetical protein [Mesorhizobium sp.]RWB08759.1 MAG: hypothetical protein EOQ37_04440 [Mesorhizobium sp.]RWB13589.1 MAG: hypothetical protein EOQ39_18895 [Mesorhizobium sp.]